MQATSTTAQKQAQVRLRRSQGASFERHQGFGTSSTRFLPEKRRGKRTAMEKKDCVDVLGGWDCWTEGAL